MRGVVVVVVMVILRCRYELVFDSAMIQYDTLVC